MANIPGQQAEPGMEKCKRKYKTDKGLDMSRTDKSLGQQQQNENPKALSYAIPAISKPMRSTEKSGHPCLLQPPEEDDNLMLLSFSPSASLAEASHILESVA